MRKKALLLPPFPQQLPLLQTPTFPLSGLAANLAPKISGPGNRDS